MKGPLHWCLEPLSNLHSLSDVGPALYMIALRFYEADFVDNKFYGPKVPDVLAAELGSYTSA